MSFGCRSHVLATFVPQCTFGQWTKRKVCIAEWFLNVTSLEFNRRIQSWNLVTASVRDHTLEIKLLWCFISQSICKSSMPFHCLCIQWYMLWNAIKLLWCLVSQSVCKSPIPFHSVCIQWSMLWNAVQVTACAVFPSANLMPFLSIHIMLILDLQKKKAHWQMQITWWFVHAIHVNRQSPTVLIYFPHPWTLQRLLTLFYNFLKCQIQ